MPRPPAMPPTRRYRHIDPGPRRGARAVAAKALRANRAGLDGARLRASVLSVKERGDSATSRLRLVWTVPRFGRFAYDSEAALVRGGDDRWRVVWDPRVVHPDLDAGTRLGTAVDRAPRGQILDRHGRAIVTPRAVVHVGVEHDKVSDPDATAAALAGVVGVDARAYAR